MATNIVESAITVIQILTWFLTLILILENGVQARRQSPLMVEEDGFRKNHRAAGLWKTIVKEIQL